jgi:lipopolysaccharide transport system permease protein
MQQFVASPQELICSLWRHRHLVWQLVLRDVAARYRGSMAGLLWSLINPILVLLIYTFVFSVVFRLKWGGRGESTLEFALVLLAGLLVYNFFSDCISRAPALVASQPNYVKKVVFPLEVLPWVSLGSALFHFAVSLLVWLVFHLAFFGVPSITGLLLPLVMLPFLMLVLGLSWWLAALGVYLRDIGQNIGTALLALHFLSPVFSPVSHVPPAYRWLIQLNPLTPTLESVRDVLVWGRVPDIASWCLHALAMAILAWSGFVWFQKTRKGFADVL